MTPPSSNRLSEEYAAQLKWLDLGRALYHPKTTSILKAGAIGFFDSYGQWCRIADESWDDSFSKHQLSPLPAAFAKVEKEQQNWDGPLKSRSVSCFNLNVRADLDAVGLPATATAGYSFLLHEDIGAVLLTSPQAERRYVNVTPNEVEEWLRQNGKKLMTGLLAVDIKQHGIVVVTSTWSVKRYALNAWQGREQSTAFGFGGNVPQAGGIKASAEWYHGHNSMGRWFSDTSKKGEGNVVFVMGLHFRWRRLLKNFKATALRSASGPDNPSCFVPLEDGDAVEMEYEWLAQHDRGLGFDAELDEKEEGDDDEEQ